MAKNLHQLLAPDNLIRSIQTVVNGVPEDIMPAGFFTVTDRFEGNQGRYVKTAGTQRTAKVNNYGAPARERNKWGLGTIPVTMLHAFESIAFQPQDLANLLAEDGSARQQLGRQTVERNLANFGQLFRNLRISAVTSTLATGYIYANSDGELLPDSTGAAVSVDYGVAAGNRNTCGTFVATWNAPGSDVLLDMENLKTLARKTTGLPLTNAIYGANIPTYFGANTVVSGYLKTSPGLAEQMVRGAGIPQGLAGFNWIPGSQAFYRDKDDAAQTWVGADTIIFCPDPSPDWWGVLEGSYLVPTSINLANDAAAALAQLQAVFGAFSYASMSINPPGITQFVGDTFLPVITNPNAIYIADVTF